MLRDGPHPALKCTTAITRTQNRKPLSRQTALEIADDVDNYHIRHSYDLIRAQHYLTNLTAALAEELRNRYDRGQL